MGGWSQEGQFRRANPEPGRGERRKLPGVWEWFLGCCDASDVIDGEECIISIMRGSGGNVDSLPPGWEFMSMIGKGGTGREKCLELLAGKGVWKLLIFSSSDTQTQSKNHRMESLQR